MVDTSILTIGTNIAKFDTTKQGDEFFTLKKIFKRDNETSVVGGTKIENSTYFLLKANRKLRLNTGITKGKEEIQFINYPLY